MGVFYYSKEEDTLYRYSVENDPEPINPRIDNDNPDHMLCWSRYSLGDENNYSDAGQFLTDMIYEYISDKTLINYIKRGKCNHTKLQYNRRNKEYDLIRIRTNEEIKSIKNLIEYQHQRGKRSAFENKDITQVVVNSGTLDYLYDDLLEELSISDYLNLLEKAGFVFLPVSIYDHSGITMYVGGKFDHFDGRWDCSQVGWIYISKAEVFENLGGYRDEAGKFHKLNTKNWRKVAEYCMRLSVEEYDQYISETAKCIKIEEYTGSSFDIDEIENESNWDFKEYSGSLYGYDDEEIIFNEYGLKEENVSNDVMKIVA